MQIITISGKIGRDAETRQTGSNEVTSFTMAVDQGYGERKQTNWFRVSVWGKKGSGASPYLLKGGVVTVVGELEVGEYEGKTQLNVRASDFTLPSKQSRPAEQKQERPRQQQSQGFDDLDDGVPF